MTLVVGWLVLPILLAVLSLGCGLLLETVSGMRLPGTLLLPGGFIVMALAVYFPHMFDSTAFLQTPLAVGLALGGYAVAPPWRRFHVDRWAAGAAAGVYAVFSAPIVLFGATFSGYIKLDDTAAYMAFLDRATNHAYNAKGVPWSTYLRVLQEGYNFGYPLGALLPLDVGHTILGVDQLWLWQPYLTFLAVLMALGLYEVISGLIASRALRACVAFFGAQAATIYGYALWGGVKELWVPIVILFAACLVPRLKTATPRQVIPLAAATAAIISGESVGGGIWIVPFVLAGLLLLVMTRRGKDVLLSSVVFVATSVFLAIPILSVGLKRLHHIGKFTKATGGEIGNLLRPLSPWQSLGIWPSGDFRSPPSNLNVTHILGLVVAFAAIFAVVIAWRRRRWEIVVVLGTAVFGLLIYVEQAVPWVAGKAIAASSPVILGIGLAGTAVIVEAGRRIEGGVILALLATAVLWSTVMQYHGVFLAPAARLMELETIGDKYAGQGPALLTEYEPYGARHLLRGLGAESPSELRVNYVYLRDGAPFAPQYHEASAGTSPDVDYIRLDQLLIYHTLITRRMGTASRPPSAFKLVWSGRFYNVWQRIGPQPTILTHVPLGSQMQPAAVPKCESVMNQAALAEENHGYLRAVYRKPAIVIRADGQIGAPTEFGYYGELKGNKRSTEPYKLTYQFHVDSPGKYGIWIGGSFTSTLTVKVDGNVVGQGRNELQWPDNFLQFGSAQLSPGSHTLEIQHSGADWGPGSAGIQPYYVGFGLGPFAIAQGTDARGFVKVRPQDARRKLCGKSLDWIEAIKG